MPIQYQPKGFPDEIICECGAVQRRRNMILQADRRKTLIDENSGDSYFAGSICPDCEEQIWYSFLDYSDDTRVIDLITPSPMSLQSSDDKIEAIFEETKLLYRDLSERYTIELEFPASVKVRQYISYHEIDHISDDIYSTVPLVVLKPGQQLVENNNLILVIPYDNNGEIYGEIKVNFNLSLEEREQLTSLSFGIWDLIADHYVGPLDQMKWSIDSVLS